MSDVAWRYSPKEPTDHYYGVPARDLTVDEFAALPEDRQALVAAGVLYEPVVAPAVRAARIPVVRPAVAESSGQGT